MLLRRYPRACRSLLYLTGSALAWAGATFAFDLPSGYSLALANMILLLLIQAFGLPLGFGAACAVYALSALPSGGSWLDVLALLELLTVGLAQRRMKRGSLIQADGAFWLLLGLPFLYLGQQYGAISPAGNLRVTVIVSVFNGLFNAICADMLWSYAPRKWFKPNVAEAKNTSEEPDLLSFGKVIFHIIFAAAALPFLSYLAVSQMQREAPYPNPALPLAYLLLLAVFATAIGQWLNRRLLGLADLAAMTHELSGKLPNEQHAKWPNSRILEIRMLIDNFRNVSAHLLHVFQDSAKNNQMLIEQTAQLQISEQKLHHLAYYDGLTGLPNRLHFAEYTRSLGLDNPKQAAPFAVLFGDLNRFKQVNDTLGHRAGDRLLQQAGERFSALVSEQCKVFRISGDEFLFVLHYEDIADVQRTAQAICGALDAPFEVGGRMLYISLSLGISVFPFDGNDMDRVMRNADIAMYVAKEQGDGRYHFYDSLIENQRTEEMQLENELKNALKERQFTVHYQPKVDRATGRVIGAEALVRWIHPEYGLVSPARFIPLAENTGIILDIDEWVLREACRQNRAWQREGLPAFPVAVNISARHFYQGSLIPMVTRALEDTGLDAKYVVLEITEGSLIKNVEYGVQIMADLRTMGIHISMDDFGTGYSSLSQLERLPISEMKLDRSFIQGLTGDSRKSSIVRAVIELGHHMELKVVAEGIESPDELKYLTDLQCDEFQGYLFSKPLPSRDFALFLQDWDGPAALLHRA
ncbi:putative bifunctional diguanylate cyclase/phosphodiesterase [Paenibacillus macerans]|uniref:putative bifunctional diguanylate cyclase/phosphodiesterase n=1 Tax=Paenibacillus macerans TaxID=44252 RepID=UPI003D310864